MNKDLWPEFKQETKKSPKSILIEQGNYLSEKTGNLINVKVITNKSPKNEIYNSFDIIVPALDNYRYKLFYISHELFYYPLKITYKGVVLTVNSEEDFIIQLKKIFNNEDTKNIITTLLSQSLE